jgi:hypothetical protein
MDGWMMMMMMMIIIIIIWSILSNGFIINKRINILLQAAQTT